jgi:hypothetical protein
MVALRLAGGSEASETAILSQNQGFQAAGTVHKADLIDDICDAIDEIIDVLGGGGENESGETTGAMGVG